MTAIGNFTRAATLVLALTGADPVDAQKPAAEPARPSPGMFTPQAPGYLPFARRSNSETRPEPAARLEGHIEFGKKPARDSFQPSPKTSDTETGGVQFQGMIDTTDRKTDDVIQIKFPKGTRANKLAQQVYDSVTTSNPETGERIKLGTIDPREANALITHLENDFTEGEVAKTTGDKVGQYLQSADKRHQMLLVKFNEGKITADEFYQARTAELELGMGINQLYNNEASPPQTPLDRAYRSIETKTAKEAMRRGEPVAARELKQLH